MEPAVMKSTDTISEDSLKYLREKRVPEAMEYLLRCIINEQPDEPLKFLHELTAFPLPPHIIVAGPPASGKGTQCGHITRYFVRRAKAAGCKGRMAPVHISTGDLLRHEIENNTDLGQVAHGYMKEGRLVPDSLIVGMVRRRLQQDDAIRNGWILDGFPRNAEQAAALDLEGFAPDMFLLLDCPDEILLERVSGRRYDPATGNTYHLKFNPPPEDDQALLDRLEQREDDNKEVLASRLERYHKYLEAILSFYAPVAVRIDANQPENEVSQAITTALNDNKIA